MAAALVAHDGDGVAAEPLDGAGVADAGHLVHDLDPGLVEGLHDGLGAAARRLHNRDLLFDGDPHPLLDGLGASAGEEVDVEADGPVGQVAGLADLGAQGVQVLTEGGTDHEADAACVGDGGHQLRPPDPEHTAANDGVANAEHLGDAGLEHNILLSPGRGWLTGPQPEGWGIGDVTHAPAFTRGWRATHQQGPISRRL